MSRTRPPTTETLALFHANSGADIESVSSKITPVSEDDAMDAGTSIDSRATEPRSGVDEDQDDDDDDDEFEFDEIDDDNDDDDEEDDELDEDDDDDDDDVEVDEDFDDQD